MNSFAYLTFRPKTSINRGQITRVTYRIQGSFPGAPPNTFTDVPAWLDTAVDRATWSSPPSPLMTGYPGNTFRPDLDIRREQTARPTCRANADPGTC